MYMEEMVLMEHLTAQDLPCMYINILELVFHMVQHRNQKYQVELKLPNKVI